ncbi:DUF3768 domain-containing protein [Novosphingobium ginsenosidimutans]|uniref:DUF3768 domain-containing protein n=1 Tax=Novosphingobium ginsenosidimutans TaxID=1176536 RepID=A0A5B8S5P2_9SPHN|nr:DUF3768 domain-containing protein [Novosphingobium ginsenosidimutans]QEA16067.1 DUF3768 domain-containing protein [Novosphingobium ginsenosidimutans]
MADHGNITKTVPRAEQIARLNDELRQGKSTSGTITITRGVQGITAIDAAQLASELASYKDFDPDNGPERDFGQLSLWGHDLLWKVDYYDKQLEYGSEDPADPTVTHRVLTVMLASEW